MRLLLSGALIFGGFAVPMLIIETMQIGPDVALWLLGGCVLPTSIGGIWLATKALSARA